jgi:Rho-binding antiterminator
MNQPYLPINCGFHDILLEKATLKIYCKIQYFSEIDEFITLNAVIKDIYTKNKEEFMLLATGEIIRLDKIVSVNEFISPQYTDIQDFTCDC